MDLSRKVVFVTPVFDRNDTGPATFAHYLWDAFRNHSQIEFHLVAPEFSSAHPRCHASGPGTGSLDLYQRLARAGLTLARRLGGSSGNILIHVNNSNLHSSLLAYDGPLWGQVNDYENADWWRRAGETIRRAGWRRFLALGRRRWLERRFLARQDLSLCNSQFTRQKILTEYHPEHPHKVITLLKAVELGFFQRPPSLPADPLGRSDSARRLVFVGRDIHRKGLDTLLQAFALLPAGPDWRLAVVGVERGEVLEAFPDLPLAEFGEKVQFTGLLDKETLRRVLWRSDLLVLPSRAEALGVGLLEALAAGLPVVAANVGGIPEIVSDPAAGTLVPPSEPAALARALAEARLRPDGVQPPAVQKILAEYSTQSMISRLLELYLHHA